MVQGAGSADGINDFCRTSSRPAETCCCGVDERGARQQDGASMGRLPVFVLSAVFFARFPPATARQQAWPSNSIATQVMVCAEAPPKSATRRVSCRRRLRMSEQWCCKRNLIVPPWPSGIQPLCQEKTVTGTAGILVQKGRTLLRPRTWTSAVLAISASLSLHDQLAAIHVHATGELVFTRLLRRDLDRHGDVLRQVRALAEVRQQYLFAAE